MLTVEMFVSLVDKTLVFCKYICDWLFTSASVQHIDVLCPSVVQT